MELIAKKFNELSASEVYEILKSRAKIFMLEQDIRCLDMDNLDYVSLHCFYMEDFKVTAYLRAFSIGDDTVKIGRVLTLTHGIGLGRKLLEESLPIIKDKFNCNKICLNSQSYAKGYYEKFGFKVVSDEFMEEGIPHVKMEMES